MGATIEFAEALWAELASALTRADEAIKKIVEAKAWEPLGYPTFAAAWADRMRGVRLAAEMRAHVVYAMYDDGLTVPEISETLAGSGLGEEGIKTLVEQKGNGVPPDHAVVRRHLRKRPEAAHVVHVRLTPELYKRYGAVARRRDVTLEQIALEALDSWFVENA